MPIPIRLPLHSLVRVSLLCLASLLAAPRAQADTISNIRLSHTAPAYLAHGQEVEVTFDYSTTTGAGVRIFVRPFTDGGLTANFDALNPPVYPDASGSGSGWFTVTAGVVEVDSLLFQMWNADRTLLLMQFFMPVSFHYGPHAIQNISLNPSPVASLLHDEDVEVTFDYVTSEAGGVRIQVRPFTDGALTESYLASASPLYAAGTGSGNATFTVGAGAAEVDSIQFRLASADQSETLLELFLPVQYLFGSHAIRNIAFDPPPPAWLDLAERVNVTFDYVTDHPEGVRVFVRSVVEVGQNMGSPAHQGAALLPTGSGSGDGFMTVLDAFGALAGTRLAMLTPDQDSTLLEFVVPSRFRFSPHQITNLAFSPAPPAYLTTNETVEVSFDYVTTESGGVRIHGYPSFDPQPDPDPEIGTSGSPLYPAGAGSGDWNFIFRGGVSDSREIHGINLSMVTETNPTLVLTFTAPTPAPYTLLDRPDTVVPNENDAGAPTRHALEGNYPNPFNPSTTIVFTLAEPGPVRLTIYDMLGRAVARVVDEVRRAGRHEIRFDGGALPGGVYVYTLEAGSAPRARIRSRMMTLLK